jgi:hypothetical protein
MPEGGDGKFSRDYQSIQGLITFTVKTATKIMTKHQSNGG